ncbi:hypothetical protein J2Z22_004842 [Paenibacillus forsythiae]|uniref:Uncharacterized protein n=1 Tax=Paenibacillus forsythiae TaxID=365616 RepID=A0ABU3HFI2_9BACL|nr:hypothetical protein [Paenibacillus forsythiae]MDT3429241.1 hypothetical protein [Paenibacillus forsythiae]
MNYLDEQILSLKAKVMDQATANNDDLQSIPFEPLESEQNASISEEAKVFHIGNDHFTLEPRTILDGQIAVHVPKSFKLMPLEEATFKYPSEHRPKVIYTSSEGTINITFNPTETSLELEELPEFMEQMADVLRSVQPIRNWIGAELIVNLSGLSIGMVRFIAAGVDGNLYNEMLLFIREGYLNLGTFNCMESDMEAWLPVAKHMVQSLRIVPASSYPTSEKGVAPL